MSFVAPCCGLSENESLEVAPSCAGATTALEGGPAAGPEFAKSPQALLEGVDEADGVEDDAAGLDGREGEGLAVNIAVWPVVIGAELEEIEGLFVLSRELEAL
jgi:hypothetical protein